MRKIQKVAEIAAELTRNEEFREFVLDAGDFISARDKGDSVDTRLSQSEVELEDVNETINHSVAFRERGKQVKVVSPVVMPGDHRRWGWVFVAMFMFGLGVLVLTAGFVAGFFGLPGRVVILPYGTVVFLYIAFHLWKNSFVMIPDGCVGLITKYGRVEEMAEPGCKWIFHPRKKVGYIVNTTRLFPYNAPIREAPTMERVNASVDLFLQFQISDPQAFIFRLGGVNGFSEKLQNAISELTRALIYEHQAGAIYDLVGESTRGLVDNLNKQFAPAVKFINANITHAEPSSQEYRMDMAAPEMVRVAKEAYIYQYELDLRKKRDEGDLDRDLAGLRENLSLINTEIATFDAQMRTAHEKEINRANAYSHQLMIEAESEAKANAALLEAQSLDIRAVKSAEYPEIFEYRYQQEILKSAETMGSKLPQVVRVGDGDAEAVDYLTMCRHILGARDKPLYSEEDLRQIRQQKERIKARIEERAAQIDHIAAEAEKMSVDAKETTAGAREKSVDAAEKSADAKGMFAGAAEKSAGAAEKSADAKGMSADAEEISADKEVI